jgi:hypothetical protein
MEVFQMTKKLVSIVLGLIFMFSFTNAFAVDVNTGDLYKCNHELELIQIIKKN